MSFVNEVKNNPGLLPKILIIIFRFGYYVYHYVHIILIRQILIILYRLLDLIFVKLLLNCDLPGKTDIGMGLIIYHPYGIFVNSGSKIGRNCIFRGQITLGNKGDNNNACPILMDNVELGVGAKIIGKVKVGKNCKIGANAVVTKSFPDNSILVGVPARNIK